MQRSPVHRLIALWAWLVLLLNWSGDAAGAHACAHHDAIRRPAAEAHAGMHGGGAHHGHEAPAHAEHGGSCTCLGSCMASSAAPLPTAAVLPVAHVARVESPVLATETTPLPGRQPYVLPYATAPPA
ncbi:hypothetical protein [Longimicrobium terrae]|uniref:DUF2946 domain-containing protein n=1 Tax=Longimicrobium terrae TaxID=1639882 RepID=A0A841GVU5_9BACT|nr:hypothetical protein [Longimicrobium terrae]MBB4634055.1 hypothetical protein [Longimicrobium terrae]MBB6069055.1 hypothetical protein [Longimicrobium terrae]NNC28231.1 hypothetical protein [Longimicrobium terrae]